MDAGVLAAVVSGGCGIAGAVATAVLGRVASGRARRAEQQRADLERQRADLEHQREEQRADLERLRVLLDEQRDELVWRATNHAATRAELAAALADLAAARRALEEGRRGG